MMGDLAGEERYRPHLPQVHAHRIVGFVERSGREIELSILLRLFRLGFFGLVQGHVVRRLGLRRLQHLDAGVVEHGEQVVQILGRMHVGRQKVVDLVVEEVTLLLAQGDQLADLVELVFKRQDLNLLRRKRN